MCLIHTLEANQLKLLKLLSYSSGHGKSSIVFLLCLLLLDSITSQRKVYCNSSETLYEEDLPKKEMNSWNAENAQGILEVRLVDKNYFQDYSTKTHDEIK